MHVVHLEDESPLQEILKVAFEAAMPSITLKQFVNSDAAVDYIEKHIDDIDLYILDIRVPGKRSGVEVAQRIRELGSNAVIAVTSAYRTPERKVLKELDCEWFAKPWHIMDVLDNLIPKIREKKKETAEATKLNEPTKPAEDPPPTPTSPPEVINESVKPAETPTEPSGPPPQPPASTPTQDELPAEPRRDKPEEPSPKPPTGRNALTSLFRDRQESTRITLDKKPDPEGDKSDNH